MAWILSAGQSGFGDGIDVCLGCGVIFIRKNFR